MQYDLRGNHSAFILSGVSALQIPVKKTQYQSFLLLGLTAFFLAHFTLLNPSSLEEDFSEVRSINPSELLDFFQNEQKTIATGVPTKVAPAYAIRDLEYFATDEAKKNWKMVARKALDYQQEQMIHARDVILTWADGQITAQEAVAYQAKNEVELFGNAVVTMNNGLVATTNYAKVITSPLTNIIVPMTEVVDGHQQSRGGTRFNFHSHGLFYSAAKQAEDGKPAQEEELKLLSQVETTIESDQRTMIFSDAAIYYKASETLLFSMFEAQPLEKQFVRAKQVAMNLKSRLLTVDLKSKKLQTLTATGDAYFEDFTDAEHPVSGTAGKVLFKEKTNLLFLMDFPQVYQDNDTITGDTIIYDRTKDTIEVDQSNAFNKR